MSEVEYAARALLAADDVFCHADGNGEPRTWDSLSEDAQEDYRTRAAVFLKVYAGTILKVYAETKEERRV